MKKYYFIILLFLAAIPLAAQTDAISYQAVILNPQTQELPGVNATGNILPNATINMQFTITNVDGSEAYQETQTTVTDAYGMVNLFIGNGNTTSTQNFNEIDWDGTSKKLKVEIDFKGGNDFVFLSDQDLTFTPYAYHRNITASGDLTVDGKSNFKGDFNIDGETNLNNNLNVAGVTNLNSTLNVENGSETNLSGNLNVSGESVLNSTLTVNGATNFNSDLTMKKLVVSGDGGAGSDGDHVALFENTGGGNADGIAIRIDKSTLTIENNFITFYGKDNYVAGRIESYSVLDGDLWNSFPIPTFTDFFDILDFNNNLLVGGRLPSLTFSGGSLPSANFSRGSLPSLSIDFGALDFSFSKGSLPSLSFNPGSLPTSTFDIGAFPTVDFTNFFNPTPLVGATSDIGRMMDWGLKNGYPGFIPTSPTQIALASVILAAQQAARDQGIVYASKGADYAEWLEKETPEEKFVFGEVVGVKAGKISKITEGADQVMSISLAPIVLGNMPKNNPKNYEKVGFMGQVPVLTIGKVTVGDYIVASGNNDGYAKAVILKDLKLQDIKNVIGKAWSSSNGQKISLINVSVGLKTNEWVEIMKQQENRLDNLELKIKKLERIVNKMSTL